MPPYWYAISQWKDKTNIFISWYPKTVLYWTMVDYWSNKTLSSEIFLHLDLGGTHFSRHCYNEVIMPLGMRYVLVVGRIIGTTANLYYNIALMAYMICLRHRGHLSANASSNQPKTNTMATTIQNTINKSCTLFMKYSIRVYSFNDAAIYPRSFPNTVFWELILFRYICHISF